MNAMTGAAGAQSAGEGWIGRRITAPDGLRLFARDYGPRLAPRLTALCLPGYARHSADFHELALALSRHAERPRRVVALDYRGRGRSDYDTDWRNYDPRVEARDVLAAMDALGVGEAAFIGVSRGGLLTMAIGAFRPNCICGAVLVDVGPVFEGKGVARIKGYIGGLPRPRDWTEAADILRGLSDAQFPTLTPEQWETLARRTWREENGALIPDYDPKLARKLDELDVEAPLPVLWPYFEALRHAPILAIRGGNSDLLSAQTLEEMAARHPRCATLTVPDQGHAPLIGDAALAARIEAFLAGLDAQEG